MISYFCWSIAGCILLICLMIALIGSLWVLRIVLDECMTTWGWSNERVLERDKRGYKTGR